MSGRDVGPFRRSVGRLVVVSGSRGGDSTLFVRNTNFFSRAWSDSVCRALFPVRYGERVDLLPN